LLQIGRPIRFSPSAVSLMFRFLLLLLPV
jgi:hypothetical protein